MRPAAVSKVDIYLGLYLHSPYTHIRFMRKFYSWRDLPPQPIIFFQRIADAALNTARLRARAYPQNFEVWKRVQALLDARADAHAPQPLSGNEMFTLLSNAQQEVMGTVIPVRSSGTRVPEFKRCVRCKEEFPRDVFKVDATLRDRQRYGWTDRATHGRPKVISAHCPTCRKERRPKAKGYKDSRGRPPANPMQHAASWRQLDTAFKQAMAEGRAKRYAAASADSDNPEAREFWLTYNQSLRTIRTALATYAKRYQQDPTQLANTMPHALRAHLAQAGDLQHQIDDANPHVWWHWIPTRVRAGMQRRYAKYYPKARTNLFIGDAP